MDINQRLLKRKIQKKNQYINTKLKVKKRYKKMTEHEGYEVIPPPEISDPMLQKRMNIYKQIFEENEENEKTTPRTNRRNSQKGKQVEIVEKNVKTKEELQKERAEKMKQREQGKKYHMQRTKKGQPVMKNIINSLLEKVKKSVNTK